MRYVFAVLAVVSVLLVVEGRADAEGKPKEVQAFVKVEKGPNGNVLTITGRIKSRHVRFEKGRSVRTYYVVTPDLEKIPLPRSHVEHRDGTISGIYLKPLRSKIVEIVCEGTVKDDGEKGRSVTVKKILSVKLPDA